MKTAICEKINCLLAGSGGSSEQIKVPAGQQKATAETA